MLDDFQFYYANEESLVSASAGKIVLRDPSGNRQEYLGSFKFTRFGELNLAASTLTGFVQYDGNSPTFRALGLSIKGSLYDSYVFSDDSNGLKSYALRANDVITGSSQNDILLGFAGNDRINGGAGDDAIYGGPGKDLLTGGLGADAFVFSTDYTGKALNKASTITDFSTLQGDQILIDSKVFGGPGSVTEASSFTGAGMEFVATLKGKNLLFQLDIDGDSKTDAYLNFKNIIGDLSASDIVVF